MAASPNYNSPELKVFKLHFGKLAESISHPERLANELYSQDMISKAVRDEALHIMGPSPYYRASKLVAAVEDQIVGNPSVLHKFLLVMRRDRSLVYIADSMSDHYHRKCSHRYVPILPADLAGLHAHLEKGTSLMR